MMKPIAVSKFRRFAVLSIALMFMLSLPIYASATADKDVGSNVMGYLKWNTPFNVEVNGKKLDAQGEMINTVMLVPMREVFEAAGAKVSWNGAKKVWRADGPGFTAMQQLGSEKTVVNGKAYMLDHEAVLEGGRLLVPVRLMEAALGLELHWNSADRVLSASKTQSAGFRIWSDAFRQCGDIPVKYAHGGVPEGRNISLPVSWEKAPKGTQSYAVVMYDIHPIADNYIHWSVLNIPATEKGLQEGVTGHLANGAVELNSYYGMEPPRYSGDHLYRLAIYALDTDKLELPKETPVFFEQLEPLLKEHSLGYASYDGFFRQ